jgi:TnpA family transposase
LSHVGCVVCIFSHVANELQTGDLYIEGADSYRNYLASLLPWEACIPLLDEYCSTVSLATSAPKFVAELQTKLSSRAKQLDQNLPYIKEVSIDENGRPILKKRQPKKPSAGAIRLLETIKSRMPARNVTDVLCNAHYYCGWAYEFSPLSGNEPKLKVPITRYIQTTFAYGCSLGPTEAARHFNDDVSAHILSNVNCRHVNSEILDKARKRLIDFTHRFPLTLHWGNGQSCGADGTLCLIREDNLLAEFHFRYNKKGGIAYHHIADNYIALFSTFIPCGVWEAVAIIEALLKNDSTVKPDIIHADTQGQSTIVFALAYLLGIKLMPRIRNWKDLNLYRSRKNARYKNIDMLFSATIKWEIIEQYWQEMMQVVLSIKAGKIDSTLLLRKLGNYSRKNKLYRAFQELGRVIRTIFLLDYMGDVEIREVVTEMTNKVEAYNGLSQWTMFGSNILVASNNTTEMEKAIKYNDIITNSIILQNVVDISQIIEQLVTEGFDVKAEYLARLSPYLIEHLKRFGAFVINIDNAPIPIQPERLQLLIDAEKALVN